MTRWVAVHVQNPQSRSWGMACMNFFLASVIFNDGLPRTHASSSRRSTSPCAWKVEQGLGQYFKYGTRLLKAPTSEALPGSGLHSIILFLVLVRSTQQSRIMGSPRPNSENAVYYRMKTIVKQIQGDSFREPPAANLNRQRFSTLKGRGAMYEEVPIILPNYWS